MKNLLRFSLIIFFQNLIINGFSQENIFLTLNPHGHKAIISSLVVSADSQTVLTAGYDKIIKVWDVSTRNLIDEIFGNCGKGLHGSIFTMSLSPDNKFLAVAGVMAPFNQQVHNNDIGDVRIYDFKSRKLKSLLKATNDVIINCAFSNDSKLLVVVPNGIQSEVQVWTVPENRLIFSFTPDFKIETAAIFGNYLYCGYANGIIKKFDITTKTETKSVKYFTDIVNDIKITKDGKTIICGSIDFTIKIFDDDLNLNQTIKNSSGVSRISISPDNNKFICGRSMGADSCYIYYKNKSNKFELYTAIGNLNDMVKAVGFIGNNKVVLAGGVDHKVIFADISNPLNVITNEIQGKGVTSYAVGISENSKNLICYARQKNARKGFSKPSHVFDLISHDIKPISDYLTTGFSIPRTRMGSYSLVYSEGSNYYNYDSVLNLKMYGKKGYEISIPSSTGHKCYTLTCDSLIISGGREGILKAYDFKGNEKAVFDGHLNDIYGLAVTQSNECNYILPEDKRLVTCSADQLICIWDLNLIGKQKTITPIVSIFFTNDNEWIIWSPDGYFTSSANGAKNVGYIVNYGNDKDSKYYPFEQFDLKYNRPDIMLDRLGIIDKKMKEAYYWAYLKRLSKMGFNINSLKNDIQLPEIEINIEKNAEIVTRTNVLKLFVKASDNKYKIDRLMIYDNGVPIHGINGFSLKSRNISIFLDSFLIKLNTGKNNIQVSVFNSSGVESLKENINIFYDKQEREKTFIISAGVSNYSDKSNNLNYASKDAIDISTSLELRYKQYSEVKKILLIDSQVTKENLLEIKKKLQIETSENDKVIFFLAGHGLLDLNMNFVFATHDIDFKKPEKRGISFDEIESILDSIPARKKVMLIDACHSGELDKDEKYIVLNYNNSQGNIKYRGAKHLVNSIPMSDKSNFNTFELMKTLFSDMRKGTGTIVISSASGNEFAFEDDKWNNGVFTYSVLKGLSDKSADLNSDGKITISEIHNFTSVMVKKLTNGAQNPTVRQENIKYDFDF